MGAHNENNDGLFLGYFDSYSELVSKYYGYLGNVAIVAGVFYYHNGTTWVKVKVDRDTKIENMLTEIASGRPSIRTLYATNIDNVPEANGEENDTWKFSRPSASKEYPKVWMVVGFRPYEISFVEGQSQDFTWTEPVIVDHYVAPAAPGNDGKDGKDGRTTKEYYKLSATADESYLSELHDALKALGDKIPAEWRPTRMSPTADNRFVLMTQRVKEDGQWSDYSKPVVVTEAAEKPKDTAMLVLTDNMSHVFCDSAGTPKWEQEVSTIAALYVGGESITDGVSFECDNNSVSQQGNVFRFKPGSKDGYNTCITIIAKYNGTSYSTKWSVIKHCDGENGISPVVYELALDRSVIKRGASGITQDRTMAIRVKRISEESTEYFDDITELGGSVNIITRLGRTGAVESSVLKILDSNPAGTVSESWWLEDESGAICAYVDDFVNIELYIDGYCYDAQRLYVVKDGTNGRDIDTELVSKYVREVIDNDVEFASIRKKLTYFYDSFGNIIDETSEESIIDQLAGKILLEVKRNMLSSGIRISADGIELHSPKITLRNFDREGLVVEGGIANIPVMHGNQIYLYDNDEELVATANADGNGTYSKKGDEAGIGNGYSAITLIKLGDSLGEAMTTLESFRDTSISPTHKNAVICRKNNNTGYTVDQSGEPIEGYYTIPGKPYSSPYEVDEHTSEVERELAEYQNGYIVEQSIERVRYESDNRK